ncbi:hypothetical protein BDN70DRAFT_933514 [Pholiota conissans]|uniref:Uncharacterized protein n=1 Tax=Pholiota conissans TaxID=109636 RepID=A0A9P5Z0Y9_9AGAR|nr:hypothetical protein BDN70DRAFT_933514 [Pholiota conissans]
MDADLDWCLTCERRLDGPQPYCSDLCKQRARTLPLPPQLVHHEYDEYNNHNDEDDVDDDDDEDTHNVVVHASTPHSWRWMPTDEAAIAAWAADIPYGAPPAEQEIISASPAPFRAAPPPNLIRPARRAVPPTLSMSTPPRELPPPSTPVLTPRRHPSTTSMAPSGYASMGQTSLCTTAATGSSLALSTPPLSQPVPISGSAGRQLHPSNTNDAHVVRSWVSPSPAALAPATARHYPHLQHLLHVHDAAAAALQKSASRKLLPAMLEPLAASWRPDADVFEEKASLPRVHTFRGDDHPSFRTRGRKESRAAA